MFTTVVTHRFIDVDVDIELPHRPSDTGHGSALFNADRTRFAYLVDCHDPDHEWPEGVDFADTNPGHTGYVADPERWVAARRDTHHIFAVDVYQHGLFRYALSPYPYDLARNGTMIAIPREDGLDPQRYARACLEEYTAYVNGDVYGITVMAFLNGEWAEEETLWEYYGSDHATEALADLFA